MRSLQLHSSLRNSLLIRPTSSSSRVLAVRARAMSYTYQYPRPAVTVDAAIVSQTTSTQSAHILLIKRKNDPFKGSWALPGGFVDQGETLDAAAARELQEETSVDPSSVLLTQVGAFGDPGRDPRGWTITVAYAALVPSIDQLGVKAADDAADAKWFPVTDLPSLAFDHKLVVRTCLQHLAKQTEAAAISGLIQDLQKGASKLEGPWQTP